MNINLFNYLKTIAETTWEGTLKQKVLILTSLVFWIAAAYFAVLFGAEVLELTQLEGYTPLPSTVENALLAFAFWAGQRYCYKNGKGD